MRQNLEFLTEALPPQADVQECRAASEDARARLIGTETRLRQRDTSQPLRKPRRRHRTGSEQAGTHHNHNERKEVGWLAFA